MNKKTLAKKVVDAMYSKDGFSRWLGIKVIKIEPGHCILKMKVRHEMLNGFAIAHGGITYSLADSALAFASNSHGRKALSIETSISHTESLKEGDVITAEAKEISLSGKIGLYHITVSKQGNKKVAFFKGIVYRTSQDWFPE
jgi:acyl-CoA thioesterase